MNWNAPIGFGKAGNDPYSMAALGGGLLTKLLSMGGAGGGGSTHNNDPATQDFLTESAAADQPLTQIPRELGNSGLLPMLLAKAGLMSKSINATPSQYSLEELMIAAKHQQRMSDMLDSVSALTKIGATSPQAASQAYKGMTPIPGVDPAKWSYPMIERAAHDRAMEEAAFDRINTQDRNAATAEKRADTYQQSVDDRAAREDARLDRESHNNEAQLFQHSISRAQTRANNLTGDPEERTQNQQFANFLTDALSKKVPYSDAIAQGMKKYPLASQEDTPPAPAGSSWDVGGMLRSLLPSALTGSNTGARAASPTVPGIVKPRFTR